MPLYLKLISDVHEEFKDPSSPDGRFQLHIKPTDMDKDTILVVAGDLNSSMYNSGPKKIVDALERWSTQYKYVIYVMGNHCYWGGTINGTPDDIDTMIAERDMENVYHLNQDWIVLDGYNFLGCTLWADFAKDPISEYDLNMWWADLQRIRVKGGNYRKLRAMDVSLLHMQHVEFIDGTLDLIKTANDYPSIVVTHHLPHMMSVSEEYKNSNVNHCYVSDQSYILEKHDIKFWCHGHTHDSCNYEIHGTRVVCNPHGYPICEENEDFSSEILFKLED